MIAGVYFISRREKQRGDEDAKKIERVEPTLDQSDLLLETDGAADSAEPAILPDDGYSLAPKDEQPQKIVTLRLVARNKQSFQGGELVLSLRGIGLRHGQFGIFHRYDGNDESRTIFSAASLVEPGSFDLANIAEQKIPGISMFLVLPGPIDGVEAFDMMMESARALSQSLGGDLLDESGSNLSIQRERYLREEVIQYQHQYSHLVA